MQWPGSASSGLTKSHLSPLPACSRSKSLATLAQSFPLAVFGLTDAPQRFHSNNSNTLRGPFGSWALLLQIWSNQGSICIRAEKNLLQIQCSALSKGVSTYFTFKRAANGQNDEVFHHSKSPSNSLRSGCYFHTFSWIWAVEQEIKALGRGLFQHTGNEEQFLTFSHFFQDKNLNCRI